jgi:hypothetical protein
VDQKTLTQDMYTQISIALNEANEIIRRKDSYGVYLLSAFPERIIDLFSKFKPQEKKDAT